MKPTKYTYFQMHRVVRSETQELGIKSKSSFHPTSRISGHAQLQSKAFAHH